MEDKDWNIGTFIEYFKKQAQGVELIRSDETNQAVFSNDYVDYLLYQNENSEVWILQCDNVELRNENIYKVPLPKKESKVLQLLTLLEEQYQ